MTEQGGSEVNEQTIDASLIAENRDQPLRTSAPTSNGVAFLESDIACDRCGYNLRSQPLDAVCPECRAPVGTSLVGAGEQREPPVARSERRWAVSIITGLVVMLVLYPQILWVELFMDFTTAAFGNAPKLNVIGPKLWAMSLVQRSIGRGVESLGGQGTWLPLMNVAAVWLLTARRGVGEAMSARMNVLRLITRWGSAALVGGFFGFMLNVEGTYFTDAGLSKYALLGVGGVELPGTALLLAYLSQVSHSIGNRKLGQRFVIAMIATFILQVLSIGISIIAPTLLMERHELGVQVCASLFQAACVVAGLFIAGLMAELIFALASRVVSQRWQPWMA